MLPDSAAADVGWQHGVRWALCSCGDASSRAAVNEGVMGKKSVLSLSVMSSGIGVDAAGHQPVPTHG
jgi:hypothetical protein